MRKKLPWFEIALAVVVLGAYIYAAFSDAYNLPNRWFIRDDAYYYFKVAQNISEGHGSTFDGIHPTNGYHPLWMLVCIPVFALARYDLILPLRVLVVITGLLEVGTVILLYRLVRDVISSPLAVLAAAYWAFNSYLLVFLYKTGVESSIALFFIVLLLTLSRRFERADRQAGKGLREIAVLGIVALLVVFSRLDLIFFAALMGVWIVLRGSPLRYLLPLDLLAIFVAALAAFIARLGIAGYYDAANSAIGLVILAIAVKIPVFYLLGLYRPPATWKAIELVARLVIAVLISAAIIGGILLGGAVIHMLPAVSRLTLAYDPGITLVLVLLIRLVAFLFRSGNRGQAPGIETPLDHLKANWKRWFREGAVYFGIVGGGLALYMLWSKLEFGAFSPVSGEVKRWWGTFLISVYGGPARTWLSFFWLDTYTDFSAWAPASTLVRDWSNATLFRSEPGIGNPTWQQHFMVVLAAAFAIIILFLLLARHKVRRELVQAGMIPLFASSWFQALSYSATGYASPKEWYWLTQPILIVLAGAALLDVLFQVFLRRWVATRLIAWVIVGGLALRMGVSYIQDAALLYPYGQAPKDAPYADVIPFLEAYTAPGSVIGMTGGGNVGYFIHDRTIVNMDGLINSTEYFKGLKAGNSADYLYESGMRYVFANPGILSANPYRGQYEGRLFGIESWGGKDLMKLLPNPTE